MSSVIYTNTASLVAQKNLLGAQNALATSVERLSSGLRINRARDDAAGLSVANSLQTQINGANQGIRNMNDAISMVQTAEGAIAAASDMGQRILTLATQGANGTLGATEKEAIINEMKKLLDSISSIGSRTSYAGNNLLTQGTTALTTEVAKIAVGAGLAAGETFTVAGLTYTSTGVTTQAQLVAAFGSLENGATTGASTATGTYSGVLTGYATTTSSNDVIFTGKNVGNMADLTISGSGKAAGTASVTTQGASGGTAFSMQISNSSADVITLTKDAFANVGVGSVSVSGQGVSTFSNGQASALATKIYADGNGNNFWKDIQAIAGEYVKSLSTQRSNLGAFQNQMEYTLSNITELSSNLSASRSRVIDTDYAAETADLTRGQILQQAATAMLAQANQMPNVILTLLK
jgi:flagellin